MKRLLSIAITFLFPLAIMAQSAVSSSTAEADYQKARNYYLGLNGVTKNISEAFKWYLKAAEKGHLASQNQVGYMYGKGEGITQDYTEAVRWYRKAAEQGDATAQYNLGTMYQYGQGVTQDYTEAVKWYRKAAEQGNTTAQYNLGVMYDKGRWVTKDYTEAVKWYRKAAEQGNTTAQYNLGVMYDKGRGVTKDYTEAARWYRKAAEQGYARAQNNLGVMYQYGQGVTQDYTEAVKWYRKAADQGHATAQNNLGYMYDKGLGVTQDYTEAVRWYRKAAEQGDARAQCNLGYMYESGKGVTQDYTEAARWYRKAVEQGHARAQNNLGYMYESGKGVTQDYTEAVKWYRKAANQGYATAQCNLGYMYESGKGVTKDLKEAEKWYKKALETDSNDEWAKKALAAVQKEIAEQGGTLVAQNTAKSTTSQTTTQVKREVPILDIVPGTLAFIDPSGNNAVRASGNYKIRFQIQNTGKGVGKNCKVKVSATGTTSGVTYNDLALNTIHPGATTTVEIPITSNMNTQNGQMEFSIQVDEPNGFGTDPQYITVNTRAFEAPLVQVTDYSLTAASGQTLKKKQPFDLQLLVQNTQKGLADNVSVEVDLPENVILIDGKEKETFSQLTAGETKSLVYGLIVNNNYSSTTVPIRVRLKEKYGKYAEDRTINLTLDQQLASTKLSVDEKRQDTAGQSIAIARLGSDVDKELPISKIQNNKTFALIIANEHYKRVAPVPYAINDGQTFEAYCRQTLGIPGENIRTLTDATLGDMKFQIEWLKKTIMAHGEQASVIFYYAGHGIPNESNKTPYLLPIDSYGSDTSTAYELKELYDNLATYPARSVTIFLDACFSGAKRDGDTREESMQQDKMLTMGRGVAIKVNSLRPKGNLVVFSAAQGDETAYPYRDQQHGMFTYFLLKKLKETEGNITLGELYNYIRENVMQQSIVRNNKMQTPDILPSDEIRSRWQNMMLR